MVIEAHEVVKEIAGNAIEIATMAIEENAKDLQSRTDKAMDIIIMFIKDNRFHMLLML